jgi:hypothetical protein
MHALDIRSNQTQENFMYISELIAALQVIRAQHGDIQVVVKDQSSFRIQPRVIEPISSDDRPENKVVILE